MRRTKFRLCTCISPFFEQTFTSFACNVCLGLNVWGITACTPPEEWTRVALIKWTGLWVQMCFDISLSLQCESVLNLCPPKSRYLALGSFMNTLANFTNHRQTSFGKRFGLRQKSSSKKRVFGSRRKKKKRITRHGITSAINIVKNFQFKG